MTEDEMVGWHHQFDGHESEQALGVGDGHGCLGCCSPRGCKESDMTEQLNLIAFRRVYISFSPCLSLLFFFKLYVRLPQQPFCLLIRPLRIYPQQISYIISVQFSYSVMSDSLPPHGLQHARLPCPSPTPGACSNSCP